MRLIDEILKIAADKILVFEHIGDDIAAKRMEACQECPMMSKGDLRCKICKCFLEVKTTTKTNLNLKRGRKEITHCPLGRWGDLETANEYRQLDGLAPLPDITQNHD